MKSRHFWEGADSKGRTVRAYATGFEPSTRGAATVEFRIPGIATTPWVPGEFREAYDTWVRIAVRKIRDVLTAASFPTALALDQSAYLDGPTVTQVAVAWDTLQ